MAKVLLVEDDKAIVSNLTEFLNNEGYAVRSVSGQTAALICGYVTQKCVDTHGNGKCETANLQ